MAIGTSGRSTECGDEWIRNRNFFLFFFLCQWKLLFSFFLFRSFLFHTLAHTHTLRTGTPPRFKHKTFFFYSLFGGVSFVRLSNSFAKKKKKKFLYCIVFFVKFSLHTTPFRHHRFFTTDDYALNRNSNLFVAFAYSFIPPKKLLFCFSKSVVFETKEYWNFVSTQIEKLMYSRIEQLRFRVTKHVHDTTAKLSKLNSFMRRIFHCSIHNFAETVLYAFFFFFLSTKYAHTEPRLYFNVGRTFSRMCITWLAEMRGICGIRGWCRHRHQFSAQ